MDLQEFETVLQFSRSNRNVIYPAVWYSQSAVSRRLALKLSTWLVTKPILKALHQRGEKGSEQLALKECFV